MVGISKHGFMERTIIRRFLKRYDLSNKTSYDSEISNALAIEATRAETSRNRGMALSAGGAVIGLAAGAIPYTTFDNHPIPGSEHLCYATESSFKTCLDYAPNHPELLPLGLGLAAVAVVGGVGVKAFHRYRKRVLTEENIKAYLSQHVSESKKKHRDFFVA